MKTSHVFFVVFLLVLLLVVGGVYGLRGPAGSAQVVHEMTADLGKLAAWVESLWH